MTRTLTTDEWVSYYLSHPEVLKAFIETAEAEMTRILDKVKITENESAQPEPLDWATAWQLAGEIIEIVNRDPDGLDKSMRQHEEIATKLIARHNERFDHHHQTWVYKTGISPAPAPDEVTADI